MTTKTYERHPISAAFPLMNEGDDASFDASIKRHGVRKAILIYEGKVLDGWHRYQKALKYGKDCPAAEFKGTYAEAVARVRVEHERRNLSKGEKALAEERLEQLLQKGGAEARTDEQKAEAAGVSVRTQRAASVVARQAIAPVVKAVEEGKIPLNVAERVARLPAAVQKDALKVEKEAAAAPKPPRKRVTWAPADAPKPQVGASVEALRELEERNTVLSEEVDRLTDRLAVAAMEATPEERELAAKTIADLRKELADMAVKLQAVTDSRDSYARTNAELMSQCATYRRQLTDKKRA